MSKQTIDTRQGMGWGHNIEFLDTNEDGSHNIMGWITPRLREGDEVIYRTQTKKVIVGKILDIDYKRNPSDMFTATLAGYKYIDEEGHSQPVQDKHEDVYEIEWTFLDFCKFVAVAGLSLIIILLLIS